jgi:hypothetical protein
MTQFAVQRFEVGRVGGTTVLRLPVPLVGEIAVGGAASALERLEDENGTRLKTRRIMTRNEMRGSPAVTTLPLMTNPSSPV